VLPVLTNRSRARNLMMVKETNVQNEGGEQYGCLDTPGSKCHARKVVKLQRRKERLWEGGRQSVLSEIFLQSL